MQSLQSEEQNKLLLVEREEIEDEEHLLEALNTLLTNGIDAADVRCLRDAGITSLRDLMKHTHMTVAGINGLSEQKVIKICDAIEKIMGKAVVRSTTGGQAIENLEELLEGGVETTNKLTEAFGEFKLGKAQFAPTLCGFKPLTNTPLGVSMTSVMALRDENRVVIAADSLLKLDTGPYDKPIEKIFDLYSKVFMGFSGQYGAAKDLASGFPDGIGSRILFRSTDMRFVADHVLKKINQRWENEIWPLKGTSEKAYLDDLDLLDITKKDGFPGFVLIGAVQGSMGIYTIKHNLKSNLFELSELQESESYISIGSGSTQMQEFLNDNKDERNKGFATDREMADYCFRCIKYATLKDKGSGGDNINVNLLHKGEVKPYTQVTEVRCENDIIDIQFVKRPKGHKYTYAKKITEKVVWDESERRLSRKKRIVKEIGDYEFLKKVKC